MHLSPEAQAHFEDGRKQLFSLDDPHVRELALDFAYYKALLKAAREDVSEFTQEQVDAILHFNLEAESALEQFMIYTNDLLT